MTRRIVRPFDGISLQHGASRRRFATVLLCGLILVLPRVVVGADSVDAVDARATKSSGDPMPAKSSADTPTANACGLRDGDSLWLVRTRDIFTCDSQAVPVTSLVVRQLQDDHWRESDLDGLRTVAERTLTVVYVHGNRTDESSAIARASVIYHLLADSPGAPALNVVVWSWPADKIRGPMRDFRTKAARTDDEAWYLARLLEHLGPRSQVNLTGYSYGARIITGATHLVGGGDFYGQRLADGNEASPPTAPPKHRVVLLAAALHNDWLIEGHFHGESLKAVEQMVVPFNPCDPALKRYDRVFPDERPLALGAYGVADSALGDYAERVEQWNVSSLIGRTHDEWAYLSSPWVAERLRETLLAKPELPANGESPANAARPANAAPTGN